MVFRGFFQGTFLIIIVRGCLKWLMTFSSPFACLFFKRYSTKNENTDIHIVENNDRGETMFTVRKGETVDNPFIQQFIERSEAIYDKDSVFILVENEEKEMLSVIGLHKCEQIGFLRSFVFSPAFPVDKLPLFFERVLMVVKENECQSLFLASNKRQTISFFELFGFKEIEQENIPEKLKLSTAFSETNRLVNVFYMWKTM